MDTGRPRASELEAPIAMPLDVSHGGELEALFARIEKEWEDWRSS
ncbi:hypothetical protein WN982_11060 [Paraburkholderia sp. IMGN_8]